MTEELMDHEMGVSTQNQNVKNKIIPMTVADLDIPTLK